MFLGLFSVTQTSLVSCKGKAAVKAAEKIEQVLSKSGKAAKNVGRFGDDAYRAVRKYNESQSATSTASVATVTCATCDGYGQVNFADEYGNYSHTGNCPDCGGTGSITQY